jgi:hypothetical protein
MFQKRKGARYLKTLTPMERLMPHVMPKRSDAQVFFTDDIDCTAIDAYIQEKKEQGIDMTYLDVFVAAAVRLYAKRPALNRFVMGGRIFANEKIWVSMALKKSLRDNEPSTTIKIPFTGHETIFEVKEMFDEQIRVNKAADNENGTDKLMGVLTRIPNWVMRLAFALIRFFDRSSMLPTALTDASPFHGGLFITYLKSLGIPGIYHHIYDLGTIGQFIAVGKERLAPVVDQKTGEIMVRKIMTMMVVADERICDGLYYARSMRLLRRILENPVVLEERLEVVERDID